MSPSPRRPSREAPPRLLALAEELGVTLPVFEGPLIAFDPADARRAGDPIYLGGDLHAGLLASSPEGADNGHDPSLDQATVTLSFDDADHHAIEAHAVEGIWCVQVPAELHEITPYFMLHDSEGRLRVWILLPQTRLAIGIAQFWLPRVPPPGQRRRPAGS